MSPTIRTGEPYVKGSDWLLHEAFCLYDERDRFKPYEKHHSTVKDAAELAESLQIPNLVLGTPKTNPLEREKSFIWQKESLLPWKSLCSEDRDILALS